MKDILGSKGWDRNRGLQHGSFGEALKRANADIEADEAGLPKTPGTDIVDPWSLSVKPKGVPVWDHAPIDEKEEAIYFGIHIHSESNPLGLHSHVIGGKAAGGHTHGPQNRFGAHHHKTEAPLYGISLDGSHTHDGCNHPDGKHNHCPENFG